MKDENLKASIYTPTTTLLPAVAVVVIVSRSICFYEIFPFIATCEESEKERREKRKVIKKPESFCQDIANM